MKIKNKNKCSENMQCLDNYECNFLILLFMMNLHKLNWKNKTCYFLLDETNSVKNYLSISKSSFKIYLYDFNWVFIFNYFISDTLFLFLNFNFCYW